MPTQEAEAAGHEDQGLLLAGVRPTRRPFLSEDQLEVAEGAVEGPSRDPAVVPIRRSNATDGPQATEVPEVGLKVVEEEAGAAKAIGRPHLA